MNILTSFFQGMIHKPQISNLAGNPLVKIVMGMRVIALVLAAFVVAGATARAFERFKASGVRKAVSTSLAVFLFSSLACGFVITKTLITPFERMEKGFVQAYTTCVNSDFTDCRDFEEYKGIHYSTSNDTRRSSSALGDSWSDGFLWGMLIFGPRG